MPFEIPIFPLNVVLFPGMQLPLHIFEPRYQLMMQRCLNGDDFELEKAFGVALIVLGREGESETMPAPVGCVADITQSAALADGRMNLMCVGRRRFAIVGLREEDEYLIGSVEWLDDERGEAVNAHDDLLEAQRTRGALESYLAAIAQNAGSLAPDMMQLEIPSSPEDFSMWVAALLPLSPHEKQPLLETTSTLQRLQQEYSLLRRAEIIQRAYFKREGLLRQLGGSDAADQFASLN
jgi:Lon protease-like protein